MKTKLIILLALSWTVFAPAQTANTFITQGTNDLVLQTQQGLWNANTNFAYAVALSPTNETANVLWAATRLLVLPQTPAGSNFLNQLNITNGSRSVYGWTATLQSDINGNPVFPANYNSTNLIAFFRTNIMSVIAASATNLASVTDPKYVLPLSSTETTIEDVTLDYGDILMLRALLAAGQFAGYTLNANNCGVILPQVEAAMQTNGLTYQWLLATYPNLLTLAGASDLANSEGALTNAIALYFAASSYIRNVRAPGATNNLFILSANDSQQEAQFRTDLTNVLLSLTTPTEFNTNNTYSTVYGGAYFTGTHSLRSLMPKFIGDNYVNNTLPDYTFGGILPDTPAYMIESTVRKEFPSLAGIYYGQVNDLTFGDPAAGDFAVFISTNQQVTVVGYDYDSAYNENNTQEGGVSAQFNIDAKGNWQFNSNNVSGVSGSGWVDKSGSFGGELDFTNGDSVELDNGYELPAMGPFQKAAGNYSGTYSGTSGGNNVSGTLSTVLSASGDMVFCVFQNGAQNDGGEGQFDSNNHFATLSVNGTTVSGTLTNATLKIGGTAVFPGGSVTFTMTRSATIPLDVPPVITTNLPLNISLSLGTNATLFLVATGSPPMCYQWYDNNNVIIPTATTNKLVVSNLQYSAAGTYSVTINNCAGGTNASVNLTVTAETIPPVISITNVTAGMVVSNAAFTVMGWATDNVAVAGVYCSLSNNVINTGFRLATTVNNWANWSTNLILAPGTNSIAAYAVDTSGNLSTTNTASLDYVVSAVLTVSTNGLGSLNPNYNQSVLQIGKNYSITATPATGFMFTNWTGGTNLPLTLITNGLTIQFMMVSNLMLQATFLDTNKPTLSITNLASGQRVSNVVFTVKGTAHDNWQVSNVLCQLDGGAWNSATNLNNWTNWSAGVTLVPGTNIVAAYAVDTSGNLSPTSSVSFQFVVTNQLGVRTAGLGTVSPNYSNAWLNIGQNYSITSAPAIGFIFTNWTISTNWIGGPTVTGTNLQFIMASNLTLQASFVETNRPALTITAPTAGQHMSNALATVTGTASDVWSVNTVWYQLTNAILSGGTWSQAITTNSYTNWSTTLMLAVGTNMVQAYAVNQGGNYSVTNSVSFVSSNSFNLQLGFAVGQPLGGNGLSFVLQVSTGLAGHIQVSTNLANWVTLTNFIGTNATLNFRDAAATNSSDRFYRAVIP